jgi:hypothetical protein
MAQRGSQVALALVIVLASLPAVFVSRPAARAAIPAEAACVVEIPSARLTVTDFPGGVDLSYPTQVNLVSSLRRLVRDFAAGQNGAFPVARRFGEPRLRPGMPGAPPGTAVLVPGAHARVTDTQAGARLTLEPVTPAMRRLLHEAERTQHRARLPRPCPPDARPTPSPAAAAPELGRPSD